MYNYSDFVGNYVALVHVLTTEKMSEAIEAVS